MKKEKTVSPSQKTAKVCNLLITCDFGCTIDLEKVRRFTKSKRRTYKFCGLTLKFFNPSASINLFPGGKANCMGAKSKKDAGKAIEATNRILKFLGFKTKMTKICVRSMVVSLGIDKYVDLHKFATTNSKNVLWMQENFPSGVTYYFGREELKKKIIACIFYSGKINISGVKTLKEAKMLFDKILKPLVLSCSYKI